MTQTVVIPAPSVNGIVLVEAGERVQPAELRRRACIELLRQAAQADGLLEPGDPRPERGVTSEAAATAIEAHLDRQIDVPEPSEEACRRYYAAHQAEYRIGERVRVRHILFAVTAGIDVAALRKRAESALLALRCHAGDAASEFAQAALASSNCPSGASGGELGWLEERECAPEFARELFGRLEIGVLPRLVHSRFGLHVVEVLEREQGVCPAFEAVGSAVAASLKRRAFVTALHQYLRLLAGAARLEAVALDAAESPLLQ